MKKTFKLFFIICSLWGIASFVNSQTVETLSAPGAGTWVCPPGVTSVTVECWGGGGAGGGGVATGTTPSRGGGGAGGGYVKSTLTVVPLTTYNFSVGAGAIGVVPSADNETAPSGSNTWFAVASTLNAPGGIGGKGRINSTATAKTGAGGTFDNSTAVGTDKYTGGNGGTATNSMSGSGGSSGGTASNGTNGGAVNTEATVIGGGNGAAGRNNDGEGKPGYAPGGAGAGAKVGPGLSYKGGNGGNGQIKLTYTGASAGDYTWDGSASTDWQVADNWTPTRSIPVAGDVLRFNIGGSVTVTNVPASQTLGQLLISGNTALELQAASNATLTITGASGADLDVAAGSSLTLGGTSSTIKIALATGTTGAIAGNVTFTGSDNATGLNHQITAVDAPAVTFASGTVMTAGTNFTGYPFGTTPNGAVIFQSGSTYLHASGDTPFGGTNSINVSTFQTGSLYKFIGVVGGTVPAAVIAKMGAGGKTFANLEIASPASGISNFNPSTDVTYDNLIINGTQMSLSGNTNGAKANIKGNVTIGTGGSIYFGFGTNLSPVVFNGTSLQTITLTDNGIFSIGSGSVMTVDNDLTINGDVTINGTLTINAGKTLTIASGKTLILAATAKVTNLGTITNNGTINFLSDATNGTATLIGNVISGGTVNVNQYLTTGRNWYIANPMSTAVSPTVASGTITLNSYNEQAVTNGAGTWAVTSDPLAKGKGYVATVSADGNMTFTGTLNNGDTNIPLTSRNGTADKAGFNLIANPYPSYLDWSLVAPESSANLAKLRSNVLWYRTKIGNNPYSFWTVNGDGIGVPNGASVKIPPMQAFWVRAVEGVTEPIVVTNDMRSHAPATDKLLKAPALNERTLIRLQVSNGENTDEAVIYISGNAQNGLDMLDAPKMSNSNVEIPEIYTTLGTEKIVINSMNNIPMDTPIGLGFVAGNAASFSLKANEVTNLPESVKLMLRDNVTMAETDLTDGVATYNFAPETTNTDRFSVIFRSAGTTTGVTATEKPQAQVYVNGNNQITIIAVEKAPYSIYNAVGQLIENGKLTSNSQTSNFKLAAGVYVFKVNNQTTRVIVK